MIVFTSDHGDMVGDHHLWRKTYAYEGSAHIPLLVHLPGTAPRPGGHRHGAPVCLQDVMPTILDACGVPVPDSVDGHSLMPLVNGESSTVRDFVHGEHSTCYHPSQEMQYLTDGRWKYIWFPRTGAEQLFHLTEDPYECVDLATARQDDLAVWRGRLVCILAGRDAGLTDGDRLVDQSDRPYLLSPHADQRHTTHDLPSRSSTGPQR